MIGLATVEASSRDGHARERPATDDPSPLVSTSRAPRAIHLRRRQCVIELPPRSHRDLRNALPHCGNDDRRRVVLEPDDRRRIRADQATHLRADGREDLGGLYLAPRASPTARAWPARRRAHSVPHWPTQFGGPLGHRHLEFVPGDTELLICPSPFVDEACVLEVGRCLIPQQSESRSRSSCSRKVASCAGGGDQPAVAMEANQDDDAAALL